MLNQIKEPMYRWYWQKFVQENDKETNTEKNYATSYLSGRPQWIVETVIQSALQLKPYRMKNEGSLTTLT